MPNNTDARLISHTLRDAPNSSVPNAATVAPAPITSRVEYRLSSLPHTWWPSAPVHAMIENSTPDTSATFARPTPTASTQSGSTGPKLRSTNCRPKITAIIRMKFWNASTSRKVTGFAAFGTPSTVAASAAVACVA